MKVLYIVECIDELFGDTSVSAETTLSRLEEIRDELDYKIDALKQDIKNNGGAR